MAECDPGETKSEMSENDYDHSYAETKSDHENDSSSSNPQKRKINEMVLDKLVVRKSKSAAMAIRWCLDRDAEVCFGCRDDFSVFVRKHHCRSCGGVFCSSCSRFQKAIPLLGYDTPTRVCGFCYHDDQFNTKSTENNENNENNDNNRNENDPIARHTTATTALAEKRTPLGNANTNSSTTLMTRNSKFRCFSIAAPAWVEDHASDVCQQCATEFALLVRRHHCRGCGGLFCWTCTERKLALPHYGYVSPVRVCVSCSSPQIMTVSSVPTNGGQCQITGHNLGTKEDGIMVEVRGHKNNSTVQCMDVRVLESGSLLSCLMPSGMGTHQPLRVTVNALKGMSTFDYLPPSVKKTSTVNTTGGELIITGKNFGGDIEKVLVEWYDEEDDGRGGGEEGNEGNEGNEGKRNEKQTSVLQSPGTVETKAQDRLLKQHLTKHPAAKRGVWKTCTHVEMLVPHHVLRVVVGCGSGSHANLRVNVSGIECRATYNHALPSILETTPVSAGGGPIDIIGKHFGTTATNVSVFIGGVQCTNVVMVAPHTKIRCIAPRVRSIDSGGIDLATRAPHLTPPPQATTAKANNNKNTKRNNAATSTNRERSNSGDERRDIVVQVSDLETTSQMIYINEIQHEAFHSSVNIETRQKKGSRRLRPASTPPRLTLNAHRPDRAPWLPDEHVVQCMLCTSRFGFFTRKHHCRNCGVVVCASCSKHTQYVEAYGSMQRVCNKCHSNIQTKAEESAMLRHQLDHIATMRSIEAGKKNRYERDLSFMKMQQPPANEEDITRLERQISKQDRRIASKQNQFNKIQQKLLNLTVNSSDVDSLSMYAASSLGGSSLSGSTHGGSTHGGSMPPSPASTLGHRTPPLRHRNGGGGRGGRAGGRAGGGGLGVNFGGFGDVEQSFVPVQRQDQQGVDAAVHRVRPYSSMSNRSVNSRASEQDENNLSTALQFSNAPPTNATRPIAMLSSKDSRTAHIGNGGVNGIESGVSGLGDQNSENGSVVLDAKIAVNAVHAVNAVNAVGGEIKYSSPPRCRSTPPVQTGPRSSFANGSASAHSPSDHLSTENESNIETPDSHSISPSHMLTSGLLRGRTLEEYSMCTFSASPERSWVGASRLDAQVKSAQKKLDRNKHRRHSSPSLKAVDRKRLSLSGDGNNGNNSDETSASTSSLFSWVARRLGRSDDNGESRDTNEREGETKSSSSSQSSTTTTRRSSFSSSNSKRAPGSSMLVAVHRGAKCVLKELSMGDEMTRQRIEREVAIRGMFQEPVHPNIAPLEAIFYEQELGKMYIHYRLVEVGNLADWLSGGRPQPWDIQSVFQQLAGTLVYLHSHQIVHRCLSLDNILIGIQGDAQGELPRPFVTDFGDAIVVPREVLSGMVQSRRRSHRNQFGEETKQRGGGSGSGSGSGSGRGGSGAPLGTSATTSAAAANPNVFVGDSDYRAPELNQGIQATSASDMWALGIMLYKATFGLFSEPVALGGASVPIPPHRNARLRSLIKALLHVDPTQRLDAIGAMVHPYFTISHAADMHSSGNVIRPDEKLDLFKRYLTTMDRSESIQFIRVRRETIVRDVLREFSRFGRGNLEKRLIVMYEGESGVDAGGLTKDMFTRFFSQLFAEHIGMFVASEDGSSGTTGEVGLERGERTYLPSPTCELVSYMEALGKVLAKVVMDGHTIDANFAPVLYKYLIDGDESGTSSSSNSGIGFSDLESFDGVLFSQLHDNVLNQTITPEYADALALDFEDLMAHGEQRIVTDANKMEYLNLKACYILVGQRKRQLNAIKRGFNLLPWKSSLRRFNDMDFRTLLCGPSLINAASIISNIDFDHGDWKRSKTLDHVVKYLHYLETTTKNGKGLRLFLRFVTGSPGLPAMGLQKTEGQPAGKICFTRLPFSQRLPEAHTCFNTVDMPDYNNYEMLKNKLDVAMNGDDGRFDLL